MVPRGCIALLLFHATAALVPLPRFRSKTSERVVKRFEERVSHLANADGILVIDGDNARGKSGFSLSHEALLVRTVRWGVRRGLHGRIVHLVDHGAAPDVLHLPRLGGVCVSFSGPAATADDVAVRDIPHLQREGHDVMLVTADSGLIARCRRESSKTRRSLAVAPPQALLGAIGHTDGHGVSLDTYPRGQPYAAEPALDEEHLAAVEQEMRARAQLTRAERQSRRLAGKRKKALGLRDQMRALRAAVEAAVAHSARIGAPMLDDVVGIRGGGETGVLDASAQQAWLEALVARRLELLASAQRDGQTPPTEHTFERVVLAERLRRRLLARGRSGANTLTIDEYAALPAPRYLSIAHAEPEPTPTTTTLSRPPLPDDIERTTPAASSKRPLDDRAADGLQPDETLTPHVRRNSRRERRKRRRWHVAMMDQSI